ncbi:hypothetical protein GCM10027605_74290 [Micromonospora zhanjiangensis]
MTGLDGGNPTEVIRSVRLTFAAHDCEPGMVRQRRCERCKPDGCPRLEWAEQAWRSLGRSGAR